MIRRAPFEGLWLGSFRSSARSVAVRPRRGANAWTDAPDQGAFRRDGSAPWGRAESRAR